MPELKIFAHTGERCCIVDLIPSQGQRALIPQSGKRVPITADQCRAIEGQEHQHRYTYTDGCNCGVKGILREERGPCGLFKLIKNHYLRNKSIT